MRNLFDLFSREMSEDDLELLFENFYNSENFKTVYSWKISKPYLHKCLDKSVIIVKSSSRENRVSEIIISKNLTKLYSLTLFDNRGKEISHVTNLLIDQLVPSINKFLAVEKSISLKWVGEF